MADPAAFLRTHRRKVAVLALLVVVGAGFVALEQLTREISYAAVRAALRALPAGRVAFALGFTAASYLALTFYDVLALRVVGRPLPWRTAAIASFTSYTLSHNLGLGLVTGGSARYRVYTAAGLDGPDVARVVGIAGATFWAGVAAVAGTALVLHEEVLHEGALTIAGVGVGQVAVRAAGATMVAAIFSAAIACGRGGRSIGLRGWRLPLPSPLQLGLQVLVATVDIAFASAALYVLIPGTGPALLPAFILAYTLGIVTATLSHVPGGIGVFEAVVLAVVPGDRATLLAALIGYRAIYYLLPLGLGVALLAWHEGARARRLLRATRGIAGGIAPLALAAACFMGGALLLLSGSLPPIEARMGLLARIVPLPFVEASHIAASLAGTGLLLLAPGLYRRLDGAFVATRALLIAGAVFSLAKGIDYEEASVCLVLAGLLHWTRPAFYRRTALVRAPFSAAWLLSVSGAIGLATWAGFLAYRHVDYDNQLWWAFAWGGDAPRFLRATFAAVVALIAAAMWRMLAAAPIGAEAVDPAIEGRIETIARAGPRTDALLALLGDKRFLLSDAGDAFLMYGVEGASWLVMSDPVGPPAAWGELLWRMRETVDRQQGRLLLYQISPAALDLAIGMGLDLIKYGEEAVVDLAEFTLDTPTLRGVRRSERSVAKKGGTFRVVPAAEVAGIVPELKAVSDAWIALKGHREKGFSLGRFDPAYLARFPCAVVEIDGRIVAFANLWLTAGEASIDLMRHIPDAPSGTMDYLFAHLLLWAKGEGYSRFSLGIAPLAGIEGRRLAPAWARAATLLFRHGERFYGFRGLRAYKDKFAPRWEPRYVAGTGGIAMARAMRDLARLIGRPRTT